MRLNREIHNFREWTIEGVTRSEIIIDITTDDIDLAGIYGDKHLCFVPADVDIPINKEPCRIPIVVPLPDGVFTVAKITRIKRNYLLKNSTTYATIELLTPFLTTRQIEVINDALTKATKEYRQQLPDKPDASELRKQAKQSELVAKISAGLPEATLDHMIIDGGV